jgi:hypothetical protein
MVSYKIVQARKRRRMGCRPSMAGRWRRSRSRLEVLAKMKKTAEAYLGEKVTEAVVTVPAYFNDSASARQRKMPARSPASRSNASSTSRRLRRLPMAWTRNAATSKVAVYDLGGGTFDISIIEIASKLTVSMQVEVLARPTAIRSSVAKILTCGVIEYLTA